MAEPFYNVPLKALKIIMTKYFEYEIESCKRILNFISNENIYLKERLTEILKEKFDDALLQDLEHFYELFLKKDELINFLRNEVAELEKIIEDLSANIYVTINKLETADNNIQVAEKHFHKLRKDFTSYIAKNIYLKNVQL